MSIVPPARLTRFLLLVCFGWTTSLGPRPVEAATGIYWTDVALDVLTRADLDGGNPIALGPSGLDSPEGVVVLPERDEIWLALAGAGAIIRTDLLGASVDTVLTGLNTPAGLAVDVAGGKVYWSSVAVGTIHRANPDGTGVEFLLSVEGHVRGLALDPEGGKIYFTGGGNDKVMRANLDGTGEEELATSPPSLVEIALDLTGGKMYWAGTGLWRADLDGSGPELLVPVAASGVALDVAAGKVYWTRLSSPFVSRADLDGSNVESLVEVGPGTPRHLALVGPAPTGASTSPRPHAGGLRFGPPSPNPFSGDTAFVFAVGTRDALTIVVYDVSGRRVRRLETGSRIETSTTGVVRWDGRDHAGAAVGPGVYFVELRNSVERAVRKVVVRR